LVEGVRIPSAIAAWMFSSLVRGDPADRNPWRATTLEWTAESPPPHGNWPVPPVVYRWPYDYGVPGAAEDYLVQTTPEPAQVRDGREATG